MRRSRAITLIELLLSISLLGVVILAVNNAAIFFYSVKTGVLDKQEPFIQGQLVITSIVERGLRALAPPGTGAFTITDSGQAVSYKLGTPSAPTEKIWLDTTDPDNKKINYCDHWNSGANDCGVPTHEDPKVILSNVEGLKFQLDSWRCLSIEIDSEDPVTHKDFHFKTAVRSRDDFAPRGIIQ